jgi:predicted esterase
VRGLPVSQYTYEVLETQGKQLYQTGQFDTFIELYKSELENFPDHLPEMIGDLAFVYLAKGDRTNALAFLSAGLERGYFYGLPEKGPFVQKLGNDPNFKELRIYNHKLKGFARQSARPQWIVTTPDGYDPFGSYPLFISLHGYGENISMMQRFWHAPLLQEKFIHAYLQSSQVVDLKNFCWDDVTVARQEIVQMASEITDLHVVRLDQIFIGGFSQGGTLSIDLSLTQTLPIRGFIALCPRKPESVQTELLKNVREIGLKGVLLTGEKDTSLDSQREMVRNFKDAQLPHRFEITPGMAHWFPENLPAQLNRALEFLLEDK